MLPVLCGQPSWRVRTIKRRGSRRLVSFGRGASQWPDRACGCPPRVVGASDPVWGPLPVLILDGPPSGFLSAHQGVLRAVDKGRVASHTGRRPVRMRLFLRGGVFDATTSCRRSCSKLSPCEGGGGSPFGQKRLRLAKRFRHMVTFGKTLR